MRIGVQQNFYRNWFWVDDVIIVTSEPYFIKMMSFFQRRHTRLKFCTKVCFLIRNHKMLVKVNASQKCFVTSYKLNINQNRLRKWFRQISKLKTFPNLIYSFKFSEVVFDEIWLKVKLVRSKMLFFERIYHKKKQKLKRKAKIYNKRQLLTKQKYICVALFSYKVKNNVFYFREFFQVGYTCSNLRLMPCVLEDYVGFSDYMS